ncbi:MAG: CGNR zinc finger domain-containing protein [Candidatus Limnocylindria bacterium]
MTDQHVAQAEPERDSELFIDFANTLELSDGEPDDHVPDAGALRAWLVQRELVRGHPAPSMVNRQIPAFRELRTLVREVVARLASDRAPTGKQVRSLNRVLRDGLHYHELRPALDGARFTVGQVGDELDQARAAIAGSLAHYLAEHPVDRLRVCADDGCRWLFVDRSPAGRRRWCDMRTCGNRAKVARHRARARAGAGRRPRSRWGATPS